MNERDLARHWNEIDALLDAVLEMEEPERAAYLERECGDRPELRRAVERLLEADRDANRFLPESYRVPDEGSTADDPPGHLEPGAAVGPYRVSRLLGQGGMGAVYLAERADGHFDRELAIKILHPGVLGTRGNERFVRERQILAGLDHQHIARLLDGGVTEDGRPYFAMEHVDGRTIDDYCDEHHLSVSERLGLFLQVCDAVRYAHGRFVVHRDLKPGNILVTRRGVAKLLDFGIAKPLAEDDPAARTQAMMMTPAYAAPEQLRGERATAETDVYGLGLVLYELLTGQRAQRLKDSSPVELQKVVLERDPVAPSRATNDRRLGGDLDAIVMRALRKEPDQRYPSVEALSRDVAAYLDNRPVSARRGTAVYRVRKLLRRHRVEAASAGLVALALTGGMVVASTQARLAADGRNQARAAQAREAAINDFLLNDLLRSPAPEFTGGEDVTVAQVLDVASRNVGHAFREQPDLEASVRETLARTYLNLGRVDDAAIHAEAARERIARSKDPNAFALLRARALIAEIDLERGDYETAGAELDSILDAQLAGLGADHLDTVSSGLLRARLDQARGNHDAAESRLRDTIRRFEEHHPEQWRTILRARSVLARTLAEQNDLVESEALIRETLAAQRERLGPDHPEVAASLYGLGIALRRQLRYDEARDVMVELVELRRNTMGSEHPETANALWSLAVVENRRGRDATTLELTQEALEIFRSTLGDLHPRTIHVVRALGVHYRQQGRPDMAESYFRQALDGWRETLGDDDPRTIAGFAGLGQLLEETGRHDEALDLARRALEGYERITSGTDLDTQLLLDFASFLTHVEPQSLRDPGRAVQVAQRAVEASEGERLDPLLVLGESQHATGRVEAAIDTMYRGLETDEARDSWLVERRLRDYLVEIGRVQEAEEFLLTNLERRRRIRSADDWLTGRTLLHLAEFLCGQGRLVDAESRFREAIEQFGRSLPAESWRIAEAKAGLGACLLHAGAHAEAERWLFEAHEQFATDTRVRKDHLERIRGELVRLYEETGRGEEAARIP